MTARRALRSAVTILATVYAVIAVFGLFFADRLIFRPHPSSYQDTGKITKLRSGASTISAVYLPNPAARYTILYSHGNAEDIGDLLPMLETMQRSGFSVLAYDYKGYGTSGGRSSERSAYEDEDAAYDYLVTSRRVPANRVIALGRSLGGAMAIDLARRQPVAALIVQSSFITAFRALTGVPILPFDEFRSDDKIGQVHCPVLVVHGTAGAVIPPWHGRRLFRDANNAKRSWWVAGAGHDDLPDVAGARYFATVRQFADSLGGR
jgi:abhydrolase domain-containing protein 17